MSRFRQRATSAGSGDRRPRGLTWRPKARAYFDENPEGFYRIRDDVLDREWVRAPFAYSKMATTAC
jgi:hypothetical protein